MGVGVAIVAWRGFVLVAGRCLRIVRQAAHHRGRRRFRAQRQGRFGPRRNRILRHLGVCLAGHRFRQLPFGVRGETDKRLLPLRHAIVEHQGDSFALSFHVLAAPPHEVHYHAVAFLGGALHRGPFSALPTYFLNGGIDVRVRDNGLGPPHVQRVQRCQLHLRQHLEGGRELHIRARIQVRDLDLRLGCDREGLIPHRLGKAGDGEIPRRLIARRGAEAAPHLCHGHLPRPETREFQVPGGLLEAGGDFGFELRRRHRDRGPAAQSAGGLYRYEHALNIQGPRRVGVDDGTRTHDIRIHNPGLYLTELHPP